MICIYHVVCDVIYLFHTTWFSWFFMKHSCPTPWSHAVADTASESPGSGLHFDLFCSCSAGIWAEILPFFFEGVVWPPGDGIVWEDILRTSWSHGMLFGHLEVVGQDLHFDVLYTSGRPRVPDLWKNGTPCHHPASHLRSFPLGQQGVFPDAWWHTTQKFWVIFIGRESAWEPSCEPSGERASQSSWPETQTLNPKP